MFSSEAMSQAEINLWMWLRPLDQLLTCFYWLMSTFYIPLFPGNMTDVFLVWLVTTSFDWYSLSQSLNWHFKIQFDRNVSCLIPLNSFQDYARILHKCCHKSVFYVLSFLKEPLLFSCKVMSESVTPWTAACQASPSFTISLSLLKLMSIELVMSSNTLLLYCSLLLLP